MTTAITKRNFKKLMVRLIDGLPHHEKLILSLYYVEELTIEEIARVLGQDLPVIQKTYNKAVNSCLKYTHSNQL